MDLKNWRDVLQEIRARYVICNCHGNELSGFIKTKDFFTSSAIISSQEGLCSVEPVVLFTGSSYF
jgi:hypothetical protein